MQTRLRRTILHKTTRTGGLWVRLIAIQAQAQEIQAQSRHRGAQVLQFNGIHLHIGGVPLAEMRTVLTHTEITALMDSVHQVPAQVQFRQAPEITCAHQVHHIGDAVEDHDEVSKLSIAD